MRYIHIPPSGKNKINHKFESNRLGKGYVAMRAVTKVGQVLDASRHLKNETYIFFLWQRIKSTTNKFESNSLRKGYVAIGGVTKVVQFFVASKHLRNERYIFFLWQKIAITTIRELQPKGTTGTWQ